MIGRQMKPTLLVLMMLAPSAGMNADEAVDFFEGSDSGFPAPKDDPSVLPADPKLMRLWDDGCVLTEGLAAEVFSRAGAPPVALPSSEVYTSLDNGVIDASDFSSYTMDWIGISLLTMPIFVAVARPDFDSCCGHDGELSRQNNALRASSRLPMYVVSIERREAVVDC